MRAVVWFVVTSWGLGTLGCGDSERDDGRTSDGGSSDSAGTTSEAGTSAAAGRASGGQGAGAGDAASGGMNTGGAAGTATTGDGGMAGGDGGRAGGDGGRAGGDGGRAGGDSGGSGAATGGMGAGAGGGMDPDPAEPDLTGLVPTSTSWVLFSEQNGSSISASLEVVDLESRTHHAANPANLPVAVGYLSPDQKTFVFSGSDASVANQLSIVRLTDNGFVPAVAVSGYENTPGAFSLMEWEATSRFFLTARAGTDTYGVEVVDGVLGTRVGSVDCPSNFGKRFAPRGYYFAFYYDTPQGRESGYARVTTSGISTPTVLPPGSSLPLFSQDGRRAFFTREIDDARTANYIELPGPTVVEFPVVDGDTFNSAPNPLPDGESVVAGVLRGTEQFVYVRAFLDGRPRVDLTDPELSVVSLFASEDKAVFAVDYDPELDIVSIDPFVRHRLPGITRGVSGYWSTGLMGHNVYYLDEAGQLRIARVDSAGELIDGPVSEPSEVVSVCHPTSYLHEPSDKLAYRANEGDWLVLVDLTTSPAEVVSRIYPNTAGGKLGCPIWLADDSALAFIETHDAGSSIFLVRWDSTTPETPEFVLGSDRDLRVHAFSY